jgi:uncharacterized SAM-binding protein YcdF (DUF218 family)
MAFILSKILWMFTAPGNLLILLLLTGAFLSISHRATWQTMGHRVLFDTTFLLFFIAIFPVGDWMMRPLENRFPPAKVEHVDGIIVIGSGESPVLTEARGQPIIHESAEFYMTVASLAQKYPEARIVYAGGDPVLVQTTKITDGDVARAAFKAYGLPVDRIVFEDKSRNTHENALYAAQIVHPKPDEKWLLVTSASHMPRSISSFRKVGWNIYPAPAAYRTDGKITVDLRFDFTGHLAEMTTAAHEYYGLLAYWLMGYIDSPWPKRAS